MIDPTVVDTNVLASGIARVNPTAPPAVIFDAWRDGAFTLVTSEHIIGELERTLALTYFRRSLTSPQIEADIAYIRSPARVVPLTATVHGVATHVEDDMVLATALSGGARYIVTGDQALLALGSYGGVTICTARRFLDELLGT